MKGFLINLLGELPLLMVFCAGFIILDRMAFGCKLWGIITKEWKRRVVKRWRKLRDSKFSVISPQPADFRRILDLVEFSQCTEGHTGAVTPETEKSSGSNDTLAAGEERNGHDPVVKEGDHDRVFSDSRDSYDDDDSDTEPGDDGDVKWDEGGLPEDMTDDSAYEFDDDDGEATYDEIQAAFDLVKGRTMTAETTEMAKRAIKCLKGTQTYTELEGRAEQAKEKISRAVAGVFAGEALQKPNPASGGFRIEDYLYDV